MAIRAHWKGNPVDPTEHHYGIPARNLTDEDWAGLTAEERDIVRDSQLYRYVKEESRRSRGASESTDQEPADSSDDQPDDPVIDEPAAAAEEGETS